MPSRNRARYTYDIGPGSLTYHLSGNVINTTNPSGHDGINDVTGQGNAQYLDIRKVRQSGGILEGNGGFSTEFRNYRCDAIQNPASNFFDFWDIGPGEPSFGAAAAKFLADTNPSRPVVDLPIYIYEMKDLPSLLKAEGDTFLRTAAHANLSYNFGWGPLLNDISNLLSFHDAVSKRETELRHLFDSGLRRKRIIYSEANTYTERKVLHSDGFFIPVEYVVDYVVELSGFVRWFPTALPPRTNEEMRRLARAAVFGLTIDLSTAWNAIPWSWLVDWCSSVGDFLAAHRNIIPAQHGPVQIMRHVALEASHPPMNLPYYTDHRFWVERKARRIVEPTIDAHLPFLSLRQLSILGSIGVTRRVPRS
jgi:hypothetical protein